MRCTLVSELQLSTLESVRFHTDKLAFEHVALTAAVVLWYLIVI